MNIIGFMQLSVPEMGGRRKKGKPNMESFWQSYSAVGLARISHQLTTAVAYTSALTALCSVGLLDVLSSTPAVVSLTVASLVRTASLPPRYVIR